MWFAARTDVSTWDVPHSQTAGREAETGARGKRPTRPGIKVPPCSKFYQLTRNFLVYLFSCSFAFCTTVSCPFPWPISLLLFKGTFRFTRTTSLYRRLQDKCNKFGHLANNSVDGRRIYIYIFRLMENLQLSGRRLH